MEGDLAFQVKSKHTNAPALCSGAACWGRCTAALHQLVATGAFTCAGTLQVKDHTKLNPASFMVKQLLCFCFISDQVS